MRFRYFLGIAAIAAVVQSANAATSDAYMTAETDFQMSFRGIDLASYTSLPYDNVAGHATTQFGDGQNFSSFNNDFDGESDGSLFAYSESTATADGASISQGIEYFFTFTNNTTDAHRIDIDAQLFQNQSVTGVGETNAFGGIQAFDNNTNPFVFFQTQYFGGNSFNTFDNNAGNTFGSIADDGNSTLPSYFEGTGSFEYVLGGGDSIQIGIWASGSSRAGRVLTPEPFTMSLGIAGIGLFARRRAKAKRS